jgi:hypothetical protein
MVVEHCDKCERAIPKGEPYAVAALDTPWPKFLFCRPCSEPIFAFLEQFKKAKAEPQSLARE